MPGADAARVAGVVLAAGSSTRMGRNKLLLDLGGETLVRRAVRAALEASLDPVIVVLGHEAERVGVELASLPCVPVVNPDHAKGVGTSLHAGVRQAGDAAALVLILADMPFVTRAMLEGLVERHRADGVPLVVSRYGAVEAPPNLFSRALFAELLATDSERCAKQVVRRHRGEAAFLAWPEAALRDVDVASDYDAVRAQLRIG